MTVSCTVSWMIRRTLVAAKKKEMISNRLTTGRHFKPYKYRQTHAYMSRHRNVLCVITNGPDSVESKDHREAEHEENH